MFVFRWKDIAGPAEFHAARSSHTSQRPLRYHGHDFAEMFWIGAGHGTHRINHVNMPLRPGTMVFMRPRDCHGFTVPANDELFQTNIAFSRPTLDLLRSRYFLHRRWAFWQDGKLPMVWEVEPSLLRRFNLWADELSTSPRQAFFIERFLLNILAELLREDVRIVPKGAPDWLEKACHAIQELDHFAGGVERFFELCGRSHEHTSRIVRQWLNTTPTDYVNNLRMAYARQQLEMSDRSILEIALDCGCGNLSHFYRLFRLHTGKTPRAYRLAHRRPL